MLRERRRSWYVAVFRNECWCVRLVVFRPLREYFESLVLRSGDQFVPPAPLFETRLVGQAFGDHDFPYLRVGLMTVASTARFGPLPLNEIWNRAWIWRVACSKPVIRPVTVSTTLASSTPRLSSGMSPAFVAMALRKEARGAG